MRSARVGRLLPAPVDAVWDLLVDARNHARWIPLTRVEADGPPVLGTRVVDQSHLSEGQLLAKARDFYATFGQETAA